MADIGDIIISVALDAAQALTGFTQLRATTEQTTQEMANSVKHAESYFDNLGTTTKQSGASLKAAFSNGLEGVANKVRSISDSFTGLNGVMSSVMGTIGLGSFKSMTVDLAMSRQQMTALMGATMGSTQAAEQFVDTMREGTSTSPVQLRMMIDAMNGIKLSTGMTNDQLTSLDSTIRRVGEASLLMGDDTEHATFVMKEAMSGLNGDFTVLKEQFGITADKMKAAGWSGAADDVDGYRNALEKCMASMGDFSGVMDTTPGKITKIKSAFSSAGLKIGTELLKPIDFVADAFLKANENGSILANGILMVGGAASVFATLAPTLSPFLDTLGSVKNGLQTAKDGMDLLRNAGQLQEAAFMALSGAAEFFGMTELSNVFSLGAHATAAEVDAGANITLTGALRAAASGAWTLTVALLSNPWTWVIIGVVAVVAIMWHLYNTNEQVRNALNGLADTLKGALMQAWNAIVNAAQQVWAGMQKLGQIIYGMLVPAWNELLVQLRPLWVALNQLYLSLVMLWNTLMGGSGAVSGASSSFDVLATIGKIVGGVILGIARTIITGLQIAFAVIIPVITFFVNVLTTIVTTATSIQTVFNNLRNGTISVGDAFNAIGGIILNAGGSIISAVIQLGTNIITNLIGVFGGIPTRVQTYTAQIRNRIITGISSIPARVRAYFQQLVNNIQNRLINARNVAQNMTNQIKNRIINIIRTLPARIRAFFQQVVNNIRSRLANAASAALSQAQAIYNNIVQKVQSIPGQISNEFGKLKDIIKNKLVEAAKACFDGAASVVSNFLSGLDRHSPGKIMRETDAEFSSLASIISSSGVQAATEASVSATNIVKAFDDGIGAGLSIPAPAFEEQSMDFLSDAINPTSLDVGVVGRSFDNNGTRSAQSMVSNIRNTTSHAEKTLIVEEVNLDCNNLTTQQSKRILWNALQGVYDGM